jgi:glutathione reductase (NADPH)
MTRNFDLVVVGTGSAASTIASECRSAGWEIAVVDSRPFGGACALRGCDPKKVLVGAAEVVDWSRRMRPNGVHASEARIDWPELMRFKRSFTEPVPKHTEEWMAKAGIATFHGRARFVGSTVLQVGGDLLRSRHVAIAAGAKPVDLKIPGAELLTTSEQFLESDKLPERILFIGGGYISFEFAHVAARAGASASILHRGRTPLFRFDPDLVRQLVRKTEELGIKVVLEAEVKEVTKSAARLKVRVSTPAGDRVFEADMAVHGAGRVPDIDDLDLAAAEVDRHRNGVAVNQYLQSVSNPAVYAAGDAAASGPPLTPVAAYEGQIVAQNLLKGNNRTPNYEGVPSVVFTIPPLASAGLLEDTARERGLHFQTKLQDTSTWYSSRRVAEDCSGTKLLVEEGSGRLLGAHLLGQAADEVINLFGFAIRRGLTAADLKDMIYSYPTHASDIRYML